MKQENINKIKETYKNIKEIEEIIVDLIGHLSEDGPIENDSDLYFLTEMLSLSRTYGNLLLELPLINGEETEEEENEEDDES